MQRCIDLGESGGTRLVNSVAPSFPGSEAKEENIANTSRHIFLDSKKED
jgi:hypothetical protein